MHDPISSNVVGATHSASTTCSCVTIKRIAGTGQTRHIAISCSNLSECFQQYNVSYVYMQSMRSCYIIVNYYLFIYNMASKEKSCYVEFGLFV